MSGYWSVLSGSANGDNNIFDIVEERALIAIGWHGVGDVRDLDFNTIRAKVREFYPGPGPKAGLVASVLNAFANQMQIGDIVLTRKPHDQLVLVGQITGECNFDSAPDREILAHTRKVEWLRTDISFDEYRAAFEVSGKRPPWGQLTVWNANQYAEEITRLLDESVETGDEDPTLFDDGSDADEGLKFGRERELQDALKVDLQALEPGLALSGIEQPVGAGRVDILAHDSEGCIVVIELKAGTAQPESIAQLLAYMGTVDNPKGKPVRGILVAHAFHTRVKHAAKAVPNVDLRSYSFTFSSSDGGKDE